MAKSPSKKIRVSAKGLHRAIDQLDKKLAAAQTRRPGVAAIANTRTLMKKLRNATKCQVNMVLEF